MTSNGNLALVSFVFGSSIIFQFWFINLFVPGFLLKNYWLILILLLGSISNLLIKVFTSYNNFPVVIRGFNLGFVFGTCISLWFEDSLWNSFYRYFAILSFFHWSEYFVTAVFNPSDLSIDSFLLNHSFEYHIAAYISWVEFILEIYFVPVIKRIYPVSWIGLILAISGELLRKYAMYTAGKNFSHYVRFHKEKDHELITKGIYSKFRHPSYVGWFYWSIGTQIILLNPICVILYAFLSWMFFKKRIVEEEHSLCQFFGKKYQDYQKSVPTGLPFINGYNFT